MLSKKIKEGNMYFIVFDEDFNIIKECDTMLEAETFIRGSRNLLEAAKGEIHIMELKKTYEIKTEIKLKLTEKKS